MAEFLGGYTIWIIWIIFGVVFLFLLFTIPCHAILLLPLLVLPLFWMLPLGYAIPINIAAWLATFFLYRAITREMRKPVQVGLDSLVGTEAEVVSKPETGRSARYLVRARGELWSAYCSSDTFEIGEQVKIVAIRGIGVVIERAENGSGPGKMGDAKTTPSGAKDNRRHCH